ncbi:MAG: hypothetical protein LBS21_05995 [Clostridiales bacterium]|nr:hypothetical protein [Clostridiales bacterium]
MKEDNITTSGLLRRLFKTASIMRFIKHFDRQMEYVSFDTYITELCIGKNKIPEHVILNAGIERSYGHQLFSGRRKPSRDKAIQLAFGFEMTFSETQALLKAARKSPLYPRIKRDAAIIFALERKVTIVDFQNMLSDLKLPLLGKEGQLE